MFGIMEFSGIGKDKERKVEMLLLKETKQKEWL